KDRIKPDPTCESAKQSIPCYHTAFANRFGGRLSAKPAAVPQETFTKPSHTLEGSMVRLYVGDYKVVKTAREVFGAAEQEMKEEVLPFVLDAHAVAASFREATEKATALLIREQGALRRLLNAAYANPMTRYDLGTWGIALELGSLEQLDATSDEVVARVMGEEDEGVPSKVAQFEPERILGLAKTKYVALSRLWDSVWMKERDYRVMATGHRTMVQQLRFDTAPCHSELLDRALEQANTELPKELTKEQEKRRQSLEKDARAVLDAVNEDIGKVSAAIREREEQLKEQTNEYAAWYSLEMEHRQYLEDREKYEAAKAEWDAEMERLQNEAKVEATEKAAKEGNAPPEEGTTFDVRPEGDEPIEPAIKESIPKPESLDGYLPSLTMAFPNYLFFMDELYAMPEALPISAADFVEEFKRKVELMRDVAKVPFRKPFVATTFSDLLNESERELRKRTGGMSVFEGFKPLIAFDFVREILNEERTFRMELPLEAKKPVYWWRAAKRAEELFAEANKPAAPEALAKAAKKTGAQPGPHQLFIASHFSQPTEAVANAAGLGEKSRAGSAASSRSRGGAASRDTSMARGDMAPPPAPQRGGGPGGYSGRGGIGQG
ncbi:hypothetical protein JCM10213_001414, partial [Rhodosporidiobolus nylandii]